MKIFDFLKNFWNTAAHIFHAFLEAAIPEAKQIVVNKIMPTVLDIVTKYLNQDMPGDQKRAAALAEIQATFKDVSSSLINWAIETAYQKLQNPATDQAPAPAAPAQGAA